MAELNQTELAWAAGFIDGEGCFGFYTYKQKPRLTVYGMLKLDVSQAHQEPLDRLFQVLGVGHVTGPHIRKNPKWSPIYHFQVYGFSDIQRISELLSPWLCSIKRTQLETALADYSKWEATPGRPKRASHHRYRRVSNE